MRNPTDRTRTQSAGGDLDPTTVEVYLQMPTLHRLLYRRVTNVRERIKVGTLPSDRQDPTVGSLSQVEPKTLWYRPRIKRLSLSGHVVLGLPVSFVLGNPFGS